MPGPIKQELHASLSPIPSPQAYLLLTQNPLLVTEEVQPFYLNPEKVELEEHNKQWRGMESTQNTGDTATLCELGPWPALTPPQPHPGAGVPGEAGSPAQTDRGRQGGIRRAGEGTGMWGGASGRRLCAAVRPGVPTGVPKRLVQGGAPQTCACPSGGPERSEGGRPRDATAGQAVSPRAATLDTPRRLPQAPQQTPRPLTVIVVAHFLLAASLTVRHGLGPPPPGCGSSSGCSRPPRPGGQTRGLRGTAGEAALGAMAARSGTPAGARRTGERRAGLAAAQTRDSRQG